MKWPNLILVISEIECLLALTFLSLNSVISSLQLVCIVLFSNSHNAMINISILIFTWLFYSASHLSNGNYFCIHIECKLANASHFLNHLIIIIPLLDPMLCSLQEFSYRCLKLRYNHISFQPFHFLPFTHALMWYQCQKKTASFLSTSIGKCFS